MKRREEVERFADLMEAALARHDDRPGWKKDASNNFLSTRLNFLFARLTEEFNELASALGKQCAGCGTSTCCELRTAKPYADIVHEAVDVANFAMMIADVHGGLES